MWHNFLSSTKFMKQSTQMLFLLHTNSDQCLEAAKMCYKSEAVPWLIISRQYLHNHSRVIACVWASQVVLKVKNPHAIAGDKRDVGLIPRWEKSPRGKHRNPFLYSGLKNPHGQKSLVGYSL